MLFQNPVGASPAIEFGLIGTGAQTIALARTPSISIGAWHYVVATYSGTGTTAGMTMYRGAVMDAGIDRNLGQLELIDLW